MRQNIVANPNVYHETEQAAFMATPDVGRHIL